MLHCITFNDLVQVFQTMGLDPSMGRVNDETGKRKETKYENESEEKNTYNFKYCTELINRRWF